MNLFQLSFSEPAANLALDEALLEIADEAWGVGQDSELECLRIWEPTLPFVVLGRSSPIEGEVNLEYCRDHQLPVLRRCSGGATIVTGPGCLMYAVVLRYSNQPQLRMLDQAHQFVMHQMQSAIKRLGISVEVNGISDLTIGTQKVSGNSLRCRRNGLLYHGTMICDFDLTLVSRCLGSPSREPQYRAGRGHDQFLTRLPCSTSDLASAIIEQWNASDFGFSWPVEKTRSLMTDKYLSRQWIDGK
jgi:lipoate-protein ligase A